MAMPAITNDNDDNGDSKDVASSEGGSDMDEEEDSSEPDLPGLSQTDGADGDLEPASSTSKKRKKKKKASKPSTAEPPVKQAATSAFAQRLLASRGASAFEHRQEPRAAGPTAAVNDTANPSKSAVAKAKPDGHTFTSETTVLSEAPHAEQDADKMLTSKERRKVHDGRRRAKAVAADASLVDTSTGDEGGLTGGACMSSCLVCLRPTFDL